MDAVKFAPLLSPMPATESPPRFTLPGPGTINIRADHRTRKQWRSLLELTGEQACTLLARALRRERWAYIRKHGLPTDAGLSDAEPTKAPPRGAKKNRPRVD